LMWLPVCAAPWNGTAGITQRGADREGRMVQNRSIARRLCRTHPRQQQAQCNSKSKWEKEPVGHGKSGRVLCCPDSTKVAHQPYLQQSRVYGLKLAYVLRPSHLRARWKTSIAWPEGYGSNTCNISIRCIYHLASRRSVTDGVGSSITVVIYPFCRCCQTNENSHQIASTAWIYALNSWRHSVRAAVRLSLKLSRE